MRTRLVLDALDMAVTTRKPTDVVHHSALGYLSPIAYEARAMADTN